VPVPAKPAPIDERATGPAVAACVDSLRGAMFKVGKPDFFVTLTTVDEFSCARRRQDVTAAAFALRHLTLETQSRGKLHPHGIFYAVRG